MFRIKPARIRPTSPGTTGLHEQLAPGVEWRYEYAHDGLWGATLFFYYFNGGYFLTPDQLKVIKNSLVPLLAQPLTYAELYGLADRSGSQQVNYQVSANRLKYFQNACLTANASPDKVLGPQHKSLGEDYAEFIGVADNTYILDFRVVLAYVWANPIASQSIFADKPFLRYARSTAQP